MRTATMVFAIGLVLAACGGGGDATEPGVSTGTAGPTVTAATGTPKPVLRGEPAPEIEFEYFAGGTGTLADFKGKPVVANFWASWCPACIAEMPDFEAIHAKLGEAVHFVGIDIQDERDAALDLASQTGVTYTLVDDPAGALYVEVGGFAMPTTLFINELGEIVSVHNGVLFAEELEAKITELLLTG